MTGTIENKVKAAEKIADVLVKEGISYVFGIPGGGAAPIFDAFLGKKVRVILTRHEQSAAIMADAYGRLTGRPALLLGQGPFIGGSGVFGIMEAYLSHSPMLVITDTSENADGFWQLPVYQNVSGEYRAPSLVNILKEVTKYTTLAINPNEAILGIQLALKHATSGAPGPAAVVMRREASFGLYNPGGVPPLRKSPTYKEGSATVPHSPLVETAAHALLKAKRPVIVSGNGVHISNAYPELKELAELLSAPVATTYKGRSTIEETHPLSVGPLGLLGLETANRAVGEADVVLVVGALLRGHDTCFNHPNILNPERQRIIQIDIDPRNAGWAVPVELALIGDAKLTLGSIVDIVKKSPLGSNKREARVVTLAGWKKELRFYDDSPGLYRDIKPILPQRLVRVLQENVDSSTILTLDAGNNRLWMHHFFQCREIRSLFGPGGHGGMGWAIPAAVAIKLANPEKPVMAVTGDGGFGMSSSAISTALQYGAPIVVVVFNDSALGMVRERQRPNIIASEFIPTNHAKICEAYGGKGVQLDNPKDLPAAVRDAFRSGLPTVIDVCIDQMEGIGPYKAAPGSWGTRD